MVDPQEWLKPETLEKWGFPGGIISGAVLIFMAARRGWLVVGDKMELAVACARLEERVKHLESEIEERDAEIARLKGGAQP